VGTSENHNNVLYLTLEDIDHSKTKGKSPQTNDTYERLHRTTQEELHAETFTDSYL